MLALTVAVILVLILHRENTVASGGNTHMGYMCLNWSKPDTANRIMATWRQDQQKTSAVESIVFTDYALILLYCLYLCTCLYLKGKNEQRRWLQKGLGMALILILTAALIDAFQDHKIYTYLYNQDRVTDLRWFTWIKWTALLLGIIPLVISLFPRTFSLQTSANRVLQYLSWLLKTIWTFFPPLLFLFLTIYCFWLITQGKDIIVAFTEQNPNPHYSASLTRLIFFIAIGFWVYVTWYSSRIIADIKQKRQGHPVEIGETFLTEFPRLAGNSCFLILELAVWQSPILPCPINSSEAFIILLLALFNLYFIDKWISQRMSALKGFASIFWCSLALFFVLLLTTALLTISSSTTYFYWLFALLLILHISFILYTNLRREDLKRKAAALHSQVADPPLSITDRIMDYFCIPREESGYFKWFNIISIAGLVIYVLAIVNLGFARGIRPFSLVILAFAVLLAAASLITAFSVRYRVNFHLLLLLAAFIIGMKETHYVRTRALLSSGNAYNKRPRLDDYLKEWLDERVPLKGDSTKQYDVYFVLADGGASRSGYWTASVLGKLEDCSLTSHTYGRFSDHVFCLSGTSGGGVGVATFFALLRNKPVSKKSYYQSAADFLEQDYITYTLARMLGPDYFNYNSHLFKDKDRAAALEESFERSATNLTKTDYPMPFNDNFSTFKAFDEHGKIALPILFVNTTRMQDGNPGEVTNLQLDTSLFNHRVDVLGLLDTNQDISMASAAILGARFPYISPAGRIKNDYFVDGGYFDNSGAGVVQELLRGIMNSVYEDSLNGGTLCRQVRRLRFHVLHIVNSPVDLDSSNITAVRPINNDLFSPLLTILGAYDMQTTDNDRRLYNYVDDLRNIHDYNADHSIISLYEDSTEWPKDTLRVRFEKEPPYSMNWFMSDTTRRRIVERLGKQPVVNDLVKYITSH